MAKEKKDEVIVRSLMDHDHIVNVMALDKDGNKTGIVEDSLFLPGKTKSPKNVAFIKADLFEKAKSQSRPFAGWITSGQIEVLEAVPESYYDAAEMVASSKEEVNKVTKEKEDLQKANKDQEKKIKELEEKLKAYGAK